MATGIRKRGSSYEAWVYDKRTKQKIRRTFPTEAAAKSWRADAGGGVRRRTLTAPTSTTVRQAWDAWLAGARKGEVRTRSGDIFKPSVLRSYETAMKRVLPDIGAERLSELTRPDLQDVVDRMLGEGRDPSTIRNTLMPLRGIYRRALARGEVAVNPTTGLELPAVRGTRDRVVSAHEAALIVAAVPEQDRALWATALYAGLRRGELMALRWEDASTGSGIIRVERSWDVQEGPVSPKSSAGIRNVPIAATLRSHLLAHRLRTGRSEGLVFGRSATTPFDPAAVQARADKAFRAHGLERVTLHECRHGFASLMIAAQVNAKALSTYMGHASINITYDRYGHLMPGNEEEAAALLNAYLAGAATGAKRASKASLSRN